MIRRQKAAAAAIAGWIVLSGAADAAPVLALISPARHPCPKVVRSCGGPPPVSATVSFNGRLQQISGFGVATAQGAGRLFALEPTSTRSKLFALFFSTVSGAGFSIVRSEIGAGGSSSAPTIEPTPGAIDWFRVTVSSDNGQLVVLRGAQSLGVTQFMATAWSPPAWMKSNRSVDHGGHVLPSKYAAYAEYLAAYATGYVRHFGIPITAISPANAPNTDSSGPSSDWTAAEYKRFLAGYLGPLFAVDHVAAKIVMPEEVTWKDDLAAPTLAAEPAAQTVGIIAAHAYSSTPSRFADAARANKPVWQTEVSSVTPSNDDSIIDGLQWARSVDGYLSVGASAWFWGSMVNAQSSTTDGQGLVHLSRPPAGGSYKVAKRLWTIGNFSRFVRPGWYMVSATHAPGPGIELTAFKDPHSRRFAIVVINSGGSDRAITIKLRSQKSTRVIPYVTSSTRDLAAEPALPVTGGTLAATLPARSITTFINAPTAAEHAAPTATRIGPAVWYGTLGALVLLAVVNVFWFATRRWHLGIF